MRHRIDPNGVSIVARSDTGNYLPRRPVDHDELWRTRYRRSARSAGGGKSTGRKAARSQEPAIRRRIVDDLVAATRVERSQWGTVCSIENLESKQRTGRSLSAHDAQVSSGSQVDSRRVAITERENLESVSRGRDGKRKRHWRGGSAGEHK